MIRSAFAAMFGALLGATLLASPAAAQEFSEAEKAELNAMIRAYILDNPNVIVEAMQVLEQRQQDEEKAIDRAKLSRLTDDIYEDGFSFVAGNPDGDVTIVEFLDYRCPYCKRAHESVKALLEADGDVRVIVKEFPILGPESTFASRAALAALEQSGEKYAAFNDAMMTWQGDLSQNAVMSLADEVGLDTERLAADMENDEIAENIRATYKLARALNITGTPGFIIGDEIVRGFVPFDALREMVQQERDRS